LYRLPFFCIADSLNVDGKQFFSAAVDRKSVPPDYDLAIIVWKIDLDDFIHQLLFSGQFVKGGVKEFALQ
jgi:hypothetical protein